VDQQSPSEKNALLFLGTDPESATLDIERLDQKKWYILYLESYFLPSGPYNLHCLAIFIIKLKAWNRLGHWSFKKTVELFRLAYSFRVGMWLGTLINKASHITVQSSQPVALIWGIHLES
jgi:hypothetical protein